MFQITKSQLKENLREYVLISLIEESAHIEQKISPMILLLKDRLRKGNFVCSANYKRPNTNRKYGDYGNCNVRIDTSVGRGKGMTSNAISKYVKSLCNKIGMDKYFSIGASDFDGRYCDCNLILKPKYVTKYFQ